MTRRGAPAARAIPLAVLLLAVSSAPAPPAAAQDDPGADAPEVFLESVDVEVVNVEVRVSDRRGRPITGLTKDDFRLFEDGRPVEITYFAEVDESRAAASAPESPSVAESPAPGTERPPVSLADSRYFVIFLDLGHLTPTGMHKTFEDLQGFVEDTLRPGDRVMVVEHQQNLRVTLALTDDRQRVAEVLAEAERTAPQGLQRRSERRSTLREIGRALTEEDGGESCTYIESFRAESAARQHADWVGSRVLGTVSALTSLVRSLAGLPGNKAVIYVGEGLDQRPAVDLFYMLGDLCPVRQQEIYSNLVSYDLSTDFHRMAAEANSNRVTFYPLHAAGLQTDASVESEGSFPVTAMRMGDANLKSPLYQMANETGGRAVFNTNRFAQDLEEISEDVSRYYSLGFEPRHGGDGRIHNLRVELDVRHHDLRYRKAYRDKPQAERIVEAMLGALLFGVEANPLGVAVEAGEAAPVEAGRSEVPIRIRVPMDAVALAPGADFSVGRLRLVLVALEPDGAWTSIRERDHPFKLDGEEAEEPAARVFEVGMELPPGENLVAVGVRDEQGGGTSYLRVPVVVEPVAAESVEARADG
jgi:VWFA-related protein